MKNATLRQAGKILKLLSDTPNEQIQAIINSGLLTDLRDGNISEVDRDEFRKILGLKPNLLELISTMTIPARREKFIASNYFIIDAGEKTKVKISYLGDNFRTNFLNKTEEISLENTLRYHKLLKRSVDKPIIAELGGKEKAETTLTEMFALMEKQGSGESGELLTNGYSNIFYIRDSAGALWAVRCDWDDDGWHVAAGSVEDPLKWHGGRRVFSRNSSGS